MGFIKNYSYLRVLFVGVPFGISCIVGGIKTFSDIKKLDDLTRIEAYIVKVSSVELEDEGRVYDLVELTTNDGRKFYSGGHKDEIRNVFSERYYLQKPVTIWYEYGEKYIKQMSVNNEILFEYSAPYWIGHFFLWLGVITLASALIYIVKHPEDLTGKKKK